MILGQWAAPRTIEGVTAMGFTWLLVGMAAGVGNYFYYKGLPGSLAWQSAVMSDTTVLAGFLVIYSSYLI